MDLYVANLTRQHQNFSFRMPGSGKLMQIPIRIGEQARVLRDESQIIITKIVEQHEPYGMIPVSEINRAKPFVGLCYSVDKKINVDAIMAGLEHNTEVLVDRGREIRRAAAVQTSNMIENALAEANRETNQEVALDELEILVDEADARTGRSASDGLREGIKVDKNAPMTPTESTKPIKGGKKK